MSLRDNQLSCQKALALSSRRDNHHPRRDRQNDHPDCRRLPIQIVALQPRPFGQDIRGEPDPRPRRHAAIAGLRLLKLHRPDPSLDLANRIMPVADHALAAIRKHEIHGRDQKCLELRLYRPGNQPTRARSQDFGERIIDGPFLTEGNNSILGHGVTLLLGGSGGLITNPVTPPSSYRHPVSPVALEKQGKYHYVYGPYADPVLTVDPGDVVVVETQDAFEGAIKSNATTTPICSARSAQRGASERPWRFPMPTPT